MALSSLYDSRVLRKFFVVHSSLYDTGADADADVDVTDVDTSAELLLIGGRFKIEKKHFFNQGAKVTCASLHRSASLYILVVGFASGVFGLYELPDATWYDHLLCHRHDHVQPPPPPLPPH